MRYVHVYHVLRTITVAAGKTKISTCTTGSFKKADFAEKTTAGLSIRVSGLPTRRPRNEEQVRGGSV